ncbi:MAG: PIG-L deacetylase family protein [Acidobacteriota bacterium]
MSESPVGRGSASRVLAVMAHPDDVEILAAGTLFHLKAFGWEVGIISMTAGNCGSATHSKEEISRIRRQEAAEAASYLGAWYACGEFKDLEIFANAQNVRRTVELLRRFNPDVVITHSPVDYLVDHEETCRLVKSAAFGMAMKLYETGQRKAVGAAGATPALYYADPVEGTDNLGERIYPQFYVDITSHLENKRQMLARHASQRDWLRRHHGVDEYLDRMTEWAARYGRECAVPYAEGFRQHLGHGYPHEPRLQEALGRHVRGRGPEG